MNAAPRNLTELIGSRICHDLISPIGAISNGVELITMSGNVSGPEMNLISQSVESANARIRFFRIAFGAAQAEQRVGQAEIKNILRDVSRGGRLVTDWQPSESLRRPEVKLAFLLLQCFETAMPWGGRVTVTVLGNQWALSGEATQMNIDPDLWAMLSRVNADTSLEAANVHFALAPLTAQSLARQLTVETSLNKARIRF